MPSVTTHYLFGEKALETLPEGLIATQEERRAFLIGNYGPDPMTIRHTTTLKRGTITRYLSFDIHHSHMTRNFMCLREGVEHLSLENQAVGRAFVLGWLGHWLLDSMGHPFVFAQQNEICAVDEELAKTPTVIHSLIESDIDSWLLWIMHRKTCLDFTIDKTLVCTENTTRIMSSLIAYMVQNVFGTTISPMEYAGALNDFSRAFTLIDPVGSPMSKFLSRCEKNLLRRKNSRVIAQGHVIWTSDECPAANLDHKPWRNELSGISGTDSFLDIFNAALERYPKVVELLVRGDEDGLHTEIAGRNYSGIVVEDV